MINYKTLLQFFTVYIIDEAILYRNSYDKDKWHKPLYGVGIAGVMSYYLFPISIWSINISN